ncbi:MAG: TlpA disulfide reductase family protein, partial [Chthoniobacteraceae bacterium]
KPSGRWTSTLPKSSVTTKVPTEPVIPESGGESSPEVGKEAEKFKLPLLTEGNFDLGSEHGKVVVLDFWATWCAPCVKSLPGLIEAVSAFPTDRVKLIGVNQSEPSEAVKRFIETRDWQLTVAMDADQKVAQKYGVTGIPHTVIVGPDGKIAWVKTGYSPDGATEAAAAIEKLLAAPAPAEAEPTPAGP